ncbi:Tetratricopeptide-like helical [Cynara cardunculus var. scolymus]|uniref:Tetratricopeptide-like helical n=1 Tax=Cynara cardunculus var. scolymus TaxID=59895 RepID=A0A118JTI7_CYNCS|nr:Tetratricopeptide-like helical [Cynara cardunculus var. scolymus]
MLHTEPSFSIYADEDGCLENQKGDLGTKTLEGMDSCGFTFAKRSMGLIVEGDEDDLHKFKNLGTEEENAKDQIEPPSPKMYLATGLGIDGMGGFNESGDVEEEYYYKMMMSEGDLTGAEDYYFRATIKDPNDGEILMQYAKLVWELHRDQDRALSYFERAVYAAPGDCNILAAYASFLWDIDQVQDESYSGRRKLTTTCCNWAWG